MCEPPEACRGERTLLAGGQQSCCSQWGFGHYVTDGELTDPFPPSSPTGRNTLSISPALSCQPHVPSIGVGRARRQRLLGSPAFPGAERGTERREGETSPLPLQPAALGGSSSPHQLPRVHVGGTYSQHLWGWCSLALCSRLPHGGAREPPVSQLGGWLPYCRDSGSNSRARKSQSVTRGATRHLDTKICALRPSAFRTEFQKEPLGNYQSPGDNGRGVGKPVFGWVQTQRERSQVAAEARNPVRCQRARSSPGVTGTPVLAHPSAGWEGKGSEATGRQHLAPSTPGGATERASSNCCRWRGLVSSIGPGYPKATHPSVEPSHRVCVGGAPFLGAGAGVMK